MLHAAEGVLGDVGSDTTFRRMVADFTNTSGTTAGVDEVVREIRTRVWAEHGWSDPDRRVILDIDATLTRVHSEKEDAAGNYKRGFGFHPVACFADCSGEALAIEHRPGNACLLYTSDAADDLLCVDLGGRRIMKKKKTTNS